MWETLVYYGDMSESFYAKSALSSGAKLILISSQTDIRGACNDLEDIGGVVNAMTNRQVLIVDDELYQLESTILELQFAGYEVVTAATIAKAQGELSARHFDVLILDVMMPVEQQLEVMKAASIMTVGLHFATEVRKLYPESKLLILTNSRYVSQLDSLTRDPMIRVRYKDSSTSLEIVQEVDLMMANQKRGPKIFIVHGRDRIAVLDLKNCLQNTLQLPEPVILAEQKSGASTIIEKFEQHADKIDVAFVLMTPDDIGALSGSTSQSAPRTRQNVVFELGYFMGLLGRKSGRVILLHKGPLEIASDLAGVLYIDISNGIAAAGEEIRRELSQWL